MSSLITITNIYVILHADGVLQLCYRWWRITGHVFWWVVIIYTMLVLCAIYTYQFRNSPETWHNITGWSYDM